MKKIVSILLLLTLVLGLFAGCGQEEPTKAENPLDSAVAYLKNMYDKSTKHEDNKLTADKELLPAVTIDGVSYPVTWDIQITSGPANCIVMAAGASAGTQKIHIAEQPEEEVRFTLVGTVSDANGNTATISIKFYSPAVEKVEVDEGQRVVIYLVADGKYMTGIDYLYTSSSGSQKHELVLTTEKAEALALTLKTNDDGTVTFVADNGMFLFCDAKHVMFVEEESDYTKFILEAAEGGQYIKCAVANYNDKPQYLEVYGGYMTCYGMSETSNLDLYIFELQDAEGANGTIGEATPEPEPEPEPDPDPNPDNNDPAADSTLTIAEAIALGASKAHNTYTEGKYYVTGVITEVYNTTYGNMKITDEDGNILTIYGTFDADGTNRYDAMATQPVAGDTVTIYGIIGQYNDVPQIKNGWIVEHTPAGEEPAPTPDPEPTPDPTPDPDPSGAPFADGDQIVIVCGAHGKALSSKPSSEGSFYQMGVDVTVTDGTVSGYAATEVWTVIVNEDGTYSFSQNGQNIGMQDSYSSMGMGYANDKWELVALENGTYALKNVSRGNYIEWYASKNNWSTYTCDDLLSNDLFQLSFYIVG